MERESQKISVVVSTKNEATNIVRCLESVRHQRYQNLELIVVDNFSNDETVRIATDFADRIVLAGPERARQRNIGLLEWGTGEFFCYLDADMICAENLFVEAVKYLKMNDLVGLYFEEIMLGTSYLNRCRRFERFMFAGTNVDAVRFGRMSGFREIGGFDESLEPGTEDWDLDRRIRVIGKVGLLPCKIGVEEALEVQNLNMVQQLRATYQGIFHNEEELTLRKLLNKKAYYARSLGQYKIKWGEDDPITRSQLSISSRLFGIYLKSPRRSLLARHPLLTLTVIGLRFIVATNHVLTLMIRWNNHRRPMRRTMTPG